MTASQYPIISLFWADCSIAVQRWTWSNGRCELVYSSYALHHFKINSSSNLNHRFWEIKRWTSLSWNFQSCGSCTLLHDISWIFDINEHEQVTWSNRMSRSTHEIRCQWVSRTISSLKADCSPSTVRRMSDSSFAVLSQQYTIHILRQSREIYIATVMNEFQWHPSGTTPCSRVGLSAWAEVFTSHSQRHWLAHYLLTSVILTTTDLRSLIVTFWWSDPNIAIILGYK